MKILYLINGLGFSQNTGIGGSDKRAVEIIRNAKEADSNNQFDILTTDSGYKLFTNEESLETNYIVIKKPFWWPSFLNKFIVGRVLSYFYAALASFIKLKRVKGYDIYFASSDFFFDVLPCYLYKLVYKKKMICMIHHHIVSPKARSGSKIINTLMYLSQRFSFWIISKTTDVLFLYDTKEGKKIERLLFKHKKDTPKVFFVKNGINKNIIDKSRDVEKEYEACFLGGLRQSKGIDEFVPIWKDVLKINPKARFLVIGGGSEEIVNGLKKEIEENNLSDNIIFTGPLSGTDLFEKMKSSKLFLFPSHEEGWGIALCEAMYCGLPIICYDLPAFKTFGDVLDKFEIGKYQLLAKKVSDYLDNENKIVLKKDALINTATKYTWENITINEMNIFSKILNKTEVSN